eukprot:2559640-Rhodomonas_salina.1
MAELHLLTLHGLPPHAVLGSLVHGGGNPGKICVDGACIHGVRRRDKLERTLENVVHLLDVLVGDVLSTCEVPEAEFTPPFERVPALAEGVQETEQNPRLPPALEVQSRELVERLE